MFGIVNVTGSRGQFSALDRKKLDGIEDGANKTVVDKALSEDSTNPVQNMVVTAEMGRKAEGEGLKFSVVDGILSVTYQE